MYILRSNGECHWFVDDWGFLSKSFPSEEIALKSLLRSCGDVTFYCGSTRKWARLASSLEDYIHLTSLRDNAVIFDNWASMIE